MGICGFHAVAVLGTDTESLHRQFVASAFAHIKSVEGIGNLGFLPALPFLSRVRTSAFTKWNKSNLVVVAGKRGRFIFLDESTFSPAITAGADFEDKRDIVSACSHAGSEGLHFAAFGYFHTAVSWMIF